MAKTPNSVERKMYAAFAESFQRCWACGWQAGYREWCLPRLENAHIVGGPGRRHDRRALVRLCEGCHRLAHGFRVVLGGTAVPTLGIRQMVWLKQEFDPEFLDVAYLMGLRVKRGESIEPEELPVWFLAQRAKHGA